MVAGVLASDRRYLWALGLEEEKDLNRHGRDDSGTGSSRSSDESPCQEEMIEAKGID